MNLAVILGFIASHVDLIEALYTAIAGGAKKEDVLRLIRQAQIEAADAAVTADLGPRP